jgi:hypothetical protein
MRGIFVIFASFVAAVSSVAVTPCGNGNGPMPKSVRVDDCDPKVDDQCIFFRGYNMRAFVEFTACELNE